jgi:hypothetical protein
MQRAGPGELRSGILDNPAAMASDEMTGRAVLSFFEIPPTVGGSFILSRHRD